LRLVTIAGATHVSAAGTPEFVRAILDFIAAHAA
jgi:hypothetical protein